MSRTSILVAIAGLALISPTMGNAVGAERLTRTATTTRLNDGAAETNLGAKTAISTLSFQNWLYDYDVYASEPERWGYWVRYNLSGPVVKAREYGLFETYEDAAAFLEAFPPDGVEEISAEIVYHPTRLNFYFIGRYDTHAEAAEVAQTLEWLGLVVEIRPYSDYIYVNDDAVLSRN